MENVQNSAVQDDIVEDDRDPASKYSMEGNSHRSKRETSGG